MHFGHDNIIRYCKRPFKDAGEMDRTILNNINSVVREDDVLWCLGDFSFGRNSTFSSIIWTRRQICCRNIHLIRGNHDKIIFNSPPLKLLFANLWNFYYGEIGPHSVLLLHRPPDFVPSWENSLFTKLTKENPSLLWFHGHTHNNHHLGPHNLCVEVRGYKPILIEEAINGILSNIKSDESRINC